MAITDYASLKSTVLDWSARGDVAAIVDDTIRFTTDYLNFGGQDPQDEPLRCREMEVVTSLTPASGVCTLPTDYLQYRRVVEDASTRRELTYITPDQAEVLWPSRFGGLGSNFTIIGSSLYTFPLVSNDVELTYYQKLANLDGTTTTNWLITKAPQVYFRGCLMFISDYVRDNDEAAKHGAALRTLVAGLNGANVMANYARAGMRIRSQTP
ncbi:MAG: hypothetical protein E5X94_00625 [Mesorhizobium sp.]|uniref:phage adaptor protein n=1 Tax=unclassified Mesorhizobium TaxID=325217 RepID=UPI000FCBF56A|nr:MULTISPECIES: hypothetical protein [unclassified Mesorhizobium]RUW04046.1 hypothetical protein EOA49_00525 [Mesorhizobium sp. M1A.F.Ca.IN.020.04.1.1]RUW04109.1 hypothetical protein EOA49_00860 [Mesorhizobium sp. M1A.F.Ca.IN.020.04.1.1]TIN82755.1 MAG: hypothetical protein E5X97_29050 [Mesorhizobium sp.]TIN88343.1 MAG: hypothetical protein E5X94_00625 [Mesorhizobium sp.]